MFFADNLELFKKGNKYNLKLITVPSLAAFTITMLFSCTQSPIVSPTITSNYTDPNIIPAASPQNQQSAEVTNKVFFDYNGNGTQESGEPNAQGIKLTYQPGDINCITNETGKCVVKLQKGTYTISIIDPRNKFGYILLSTSVVQKIEDGLKKDILGDTTIEIPLGEGFLTLPFSNDVEYIVRSYFDVDKRKGFTKDWKGETQTYDGHFGTDFPLQINTAILASAPGIVTSSTYNREGGNVIRIKHDVDGWSDYGHLNEMRVKAGDIVKRGELIGMSGSSGRTTYPHLHFDFISFKGGSIIDIYRNINDSHSKSLWTVENEPKYPQMLVTIPQ